jgi:hypothetical protein
MRAGKIFFKELKEAERPLPDLFGTLGVKFG